MIKKIIDLFLNLLSKDNQDLNILEKESEVFWSDLCRLRKTFDNKIYFFDYQNPNIKKSIDQIKHKRNKNILEKITSSIADQLLEELSELQTLNCFVPKYMISLPRSNDKKDFNHGDDIALSIIKKLKHKELRHLKKVLKKSKKTTPQHYLKREERMTNLKNTMYVNQRYIRRLRNEDIILIDDVTTTGASFDEAIRALNNIDVRKIICIAIAH